MGSLELVALFVVAVCIFTPVDVESRAFIQRRDATFWCSQSNPCGWEVYTPFTRNIELFVKSPCDCPETTYCVRVSDDISISAYVHQCRPINENIEAWPSDNYN